MASVTKRMPLNGSRGKQSSTGASQETTTDRSSGHGGDWKGKKQAPDPLSKRSAGKPKKQDDHLDLSNVQITTPPVLSAYTNLHKLNISKCGLTNLSFVKGVKNTLTWLNVSGNPELNNQDAWGGVDQLSDLFVLNASYCQLSEVPTVVEVLHSLKALVVSHNSLKSLDHVTRLSHLNTIVASNNALTSLPASLITLPSLKKLSAAHNDLTSDGLPDLSPLGSLREVKLNDNPHLTSLPAHFASWGKGLSSVASSGNSKRGSGLEIVDLGNCGFEDWLGLKALASQISITNLSIQGTKVAMKAQNTMEKGGFEDYKSKLTILLPSLRVLDSKRFDEKFKDLKLKRDSRMPQQRILDAGPMALAINARAENPVPIPEKALQELARRGRKRMSFNSDSTMKFSEKLVQASEPGLNCSKIQQLNLPEATKDNMDKQRQRKKRKIDNDNEDVAGGTNLKMERVAINKVPDSSIKAVEYAGDVDNTAALGTEAGSTTVEGADVVLRPPRKRGRRSKGIQTALESSIQSPSEAEMKKDTSTPRLGKMEPIARKQKQKGGVLAALRGVEVEGNKEANVSSAAPLIAIDSSKIPTELKVAPEIMETKSKPAIFKVIEVSNKSHRPAVTEKGDLGGLLGLAKADAAANVVHGWG